MVYDLMRMLHFVNKLKFMLDNGSFNYCAKEIRESIDELGKHLDKLIEENRSQIKEDDNE